ncbi:MAG: tryptophan synthase subunit alpha [Cardiobacteriaceae bacterium]|nr:tryptophan synthase subunit alpha [Cardiobacteriaceae bacterium]
MNTRITEKFQKLKAENRKALITYICAGDPDIRKTTAVMQSLVKNGADILELGIAFSDPAADGKTIQAANERALARNVSFDDCLNVVREFRQTDTDTPIVLMGYLNSFERRGADIAFEQAKNSGADAVILVDCPIEALPDYEKSLQSAQLTPILLCSPTTDEARQTKIAEKAGGFIYFVSLRGITGREQAEVSNELVEQIARLRAKTDLPICIGFGIRDAETARKMADCADGIIIGSAIVSRLYENQGEKMAEKIGEFVAEIRAALDA